MEIKAYIGLGSNTGDRTENLRQAVKLLTGTPGLAVTRFSSFYYGPAREMTDQPDFLNAVVEISTSLSPEETLRDLLTIEQTMGRVRTRDKGPRNVDLDLLLHGETVMKTSYLTLPHPRMLKRDFVLHPLAEVVSDLIIPGTGHTVNDYLGKLETDDQFRKIESELEKESAT
ncbi:MAG: 2-amino-4-hydroxy-6-hydroxymethyldihydropteridine diphosphokinase [bacterium]|jgi:2-amino-4-hydroxy-6-hydroxymethyldihydropteridine diphosphokinase|nr:2-amino-4-hydroxy-6-hydroxymethyldihydropteridine diphosphokinase [bacterium]